MGEMAQQNVRVWLMRCATLGALTIVLLGGGSDGAVPRTDVRPSLRVTERLQRETILVNGRLRHFRVYVPGSGSPRLRPVLAFHGGGSDGGRLQLLIGDGLDTLAEAHGFLVIYPDAYLRGWNGCRSRAPYLANRLDVDDVAFVRRLLRWAADTYDTQDSPAFAIGYSSGGHLVYRLALEAPELLRAGSVFAANLPASDALDCRPSLAPVAMMIVNGTADRINPYDGGDAVLPDGRRLGRVRSALETARYFAHLAGQTAPAPRRERVLKPSRTHGIWLDRRRWNRGTHPVLLYTVHGGGHTIPGTNAAFLPLYLGRVEKRFDAIHETVRFFLDEQRHGMRRARSTDLVQR
jgi:polyhydroxybutyrate depolymerase